MNSLSSQISSFWILLIGFQIISHPIVVVSGRMYGFLVIIYDALMKQFEEMQISENPSKTEKFCRFITSINYTTLTMNILCKNYNNKLLILILYHNNINQFSLHHIKTNLVGFFQFVCALFCEESLAETVIEQNQFLTSRLTLTIISYIIGAMHFVTIESIDLNVFYLIAFGFVVTINVLDELVIYRKKMKTRRLMENLNHIIDSLNSNE